MYNYIKYIIFSLNLYLLYIYILKYKYIKIYTFQLIKELDKKI